MGNGPGDFKEYRDLTEKYPRLCGGYVWEWCDHGIYKGVAENGKAMYWYGGDHGELQHDDNFCLDGLVYPDRTPHTGLLEFKNVHRPLRASYDPAEGMLTIGNYLDFLDLSPYVRADYSLTLDGEEIAHGSLSLPPVPPHGYAKVPLSLEIPEKGRCFLCVTYVLTNPLQGLPAGHELGFDDIEIRTSDQRNQTAVAMFPFAYEETTASSSANAETTASSSANAGSETASASLPEVTETGTDLVIEGSKFTYTLDTLSGRFTSLVKNGREILTKPVDFNLWRAPTDNDTPIMERWKFERLDHTVTRAYSVDWENTADAVVVRIRQSVAAMSVQPILRIEAICSIYPDGSIRMEIAAEKDREFLTLPRIGLRLFLDPALGEVTYYGIGPHESYIDKCRSGKHGIYHSSVADLHEDYIRPQENGSHTGCDYVRLEGDGLAFTAATGDENTFSFNASVYTQEELETKRHNYELTPCGSTVLCIDHKMAGIGSKSGGPDLSKEYRVDADTYHFSFLLRPEV
jgi:beta-galactosidase